MNLWPTGKLNIYGNHENVHSEAVTSKKEKFVLDDERSEASYKDVFFRRARRKTVAGPHLKFSPDILNGRAPPVQPQILR